jgi:signal transduction histidine kinase
LLNEGDPAGSPAGVVVGYALLGGVVLLWQRRAHLAGYVAVWLHALGSLAIAGYRPTLPLLVALYTVAAYRAGRASLVALLAASAPIALAVADGVREAPAEERLSTMVGLGLLLVLIHCGAYGLGRWARRSRQRAEALERGRESAARDAIELERSRIANELHDIVAHSVTVMTLQAAGARKVMRQDPNRAEEALTQVGGAGKQAMSELRRMLGELRPGRASTSGPGGAGTGAPEPGLHRLDDLLATVRATGVGVTLQREGTPEPPDSTVDLAAYRVVQEALTNVAKHAGPGTSAAVLVRWQPGQVHIEVTDDGRVQPAAGPAEPPTAERTPTGDTLSTGHGLVGLAERVASLGGRLECGTVPGSGFRVSATLPTGPPATAARGPSGSASAAGGPSGDARAPAGPAERLRRSEDASARAPR